MTGIKGDWQQEAKNFPEFSKGDIEVFHEAFETFDADNSGAIDAKELEGVLKHFGQKATSEDITFLVQTFDADNSGVIEWGEFLQMMHYFFTWKVREFEVEYVIPATTNFPYLSKKDISVCLEVFREFDEDESNTIDSHELRKALKFMGQGVSDETLHALLGKYSSEQTGTLSWVDFLSVVDSFYPEKKREFERKYLRPAQKFPEFSHEDIDALVQAFRRYDEDDSGAIDVHELRNMYKHLGNTTSQYVTNKSGSPITEQKAQEILEKHDTDQSGSIDWPEFLSIISTQYSDKKADFEKKYLSAHSQFPMFSTEEIGYLLEAFRIFDEDNSGNIDIHELAELFKQIGQGVTKNELHEMMNKYDTDGNGTLDWIEFLTIMRDIYAKEQAEAKTEAPKKAAEPVKTAEPAKTTPATATAPVKPTTPTTTASPKFNAGAHRGPTATSTTPSNKCPICGKTVYATEAILVGSSNYHKGCFRCEEPGCGISLTLKNFKTAEEKIWCEKHVPKAKATTVGLEGNMTLASQANAPKLKAEAGIKKDQRMSFAPGKTGPIDPKDQKE